MTTMLTFHKTPNSSDEPVRALTEGTELFNVAPLSEEFYDRDETGPMFTAEAVGWDGVFHLFADEINNLPEETP